MTAIVLLLFYLLSLSGRAQGQGEICGRTVNASSGVLTSPEFPSTYPNNTDYEVCIASPTGKQITLALPVVRTAFNDTLTIHDMNTGDDVFFASGIFSILLTISDYVRITFHSDSSGGDKGWRLVWDDEPIRKEVTGTDGVMSFPELPSGFPPRIYEVVLNFPEGVTTATLFNVSIDCQWDNILLFRRDPRIFPFLLYCSSAKRFTEFWPGSRMVYTSGFNQSTPRSIAMEYPAERCTTSINESSGVLTSPGFPSDVEHLLDFITCISSPVGNNISINFTFMDVDCSTTTIHIVDEQTYAPIKSGICGTTLEHIRTGTPSVSIRFRTDLQVSGQGWSLVWDDGFIAPTTTTTAATTTSAATTTATTTDHPSSTTWNAQTTPSGPAISTFSTHRPRPRSIYNNTPCERSPKFYGVCQMNNMECTNGTYTDGLCRRPNNRGQILSNGGEIHRSCCIEGDTTGYEPRQDVY